MTKTQYKAKKPNTTFGKPRRYTRVDPGSKKRALVKARVLSLEVRVALLESHMDYIILANGEAKLEEE